MLVDWGFLQHAKLTTLFLLALDKLFKTFTYEFIVQTLEFGSDFSNLLVVGELLGHWVLLEVDVGEAWHAPQVLDLVDG